MGNCDTLSSRIAKLFVCFRCEKLLLILFQGELYFLFCFNTSFTAHSVPVQALLLILFQSKL